MPQIPRLGINQVAAAQGPQQRVDTNVNQEAFGLGNARSVAPDIAAFAQKIKNDADQVAAMEAENKLIEYQNKFLYDPKDGMIAKKGKDAFNLQNDLNESFAKTNAEIGETLSNPVQRALFEKAAAGRRADMDSQTMKYVSTQIQQYDDETTSAKITAEMNNAVNGYQDPELITKSMMRQEQAFVDYGNRHGLSPEVVKGKIDEAKSKTHSSIVSRMLANGDDLAAEAYYKANADGVLGLQKESVEKELEFGSTRGKSQRFGDEVMGKGMSEAQAYAEAAKEENPKVREAKEQRVSHIYRMKDEAEKQRQEQLYTYAGKKVLESGTLDTIPVNIIASLAPDKIKELRSLADSNPVIDDNTNFYKLKMMASSPETRSKFVAADLSVEVLGKLNKQHREEIIDLQTSLRNKDGKADKELDGIYTSSQVVQQVYEKAGFDKSKDSEFQIIIDKDVADIQKATGKKLSNEEIRQIANKYAAEAVASKGFFWDTKKPKYQILNEISPEDRINIEKSLKANRKPINNENILNLYLMKVNK
jgi:hypothetical protein